MLYMLFAPVLPDINDITIPVCIRIEKTEEDVCIDKNLKVTGTSEYEYFISGRQFHIWKKARVPAVAEYMIIAIIVSWLLAVVWFRAGFRIVPGICLLVFVLLYTGAMVKMFRLNKKRSSYPIFEINFE